MAKQLAGFKTVHIFSERYFQTDVNPFPANIPFMDKPGSWFVLAKCVKKHLWKSYILTKDASDWPTSLLKKSSMGVFSHIFLVKANYLAFSYMEHSNIDWNWVKNSQVLGTLAFISHSSESNLYWFPLHVISGKCNSSTISFSFIHVLLLTFSIYIFLSFENASKI